MTMEARDLTYRQKLVLKYLKEGMTNKEIAQEMYTSDATVENLLRRLFQRYEVKTRTKLLSLAHQSNLFHQLNQEA